MTTKDIRQQIIEHLQGCEARTQDEDDTELYEALPMTYGEVVRRAKGIREELGLPGSLRINAEHFSLPTGYETFEWQAFYHEDFRKSEILRANTGFGLLAAIRATLENFAHPETDKLESVGAPELCLKGDE